jgi:hypothetical protein
MLADERSWLSVESRKLAFHLGIVALTGSLHGPLSPRVLT